MIYLDYYAAAPLLPAVRQSMNAALEQGWANASSVHRMGQDARSLVEQARESVARAMGAHSADVVLTSSGTEACNLAITGLLAAGRIQRIVSTSLEHPAVLDCVVRSRLRDVDVQIIKPDKGMMPTAEEVRPLLHERTLLAVQCVNHETGVKLPAADYAKMAKNCGALVFMDAVAQFANEEVRTEDLGADLLVVSSPKIGGPTGAGALFAHRSLKLEPMLVGGMQERGRRAGTANAALLAGFGAACDELATTRAQNAGPIAGLRDRLEAGLVELGAVVNRGNMDRTSTATNLSFHGWRSEWLVAALDLEGICVSAGAACSAGLEQPSPSVAALHPDEPFRAKSAVRLSLGPGLDSSAIDAALLAFRAVLSRSKPQK